MDAFDSSDWQIADDKIASRFDKDSTPNIYMF